MNETNPALLGLYVHWPYCAKICPYCDFNVRPEKGQETDFLVEAIVQDIHGWKQRMDTPRPLASLSFGGGTPSRMTPAQMGQILQAADQAFGFQADAEISLEANPNDMEAGRYPAFADLGVNRLSLGVQSLDDGQLQFLGRNHTAQQAQKALHIAQRCFAQVSGDFIYGLPEQKVSEWSQELESILALGLDHLSLYCLTIEPKTAFYQRQQKGILVPPDDDDMADLYEQTQRQTMRAGMKRYEISNHARTRCNQSQHNLLYWRGENWIGVGPGAHGRVQMGSKRCAVSTVLRPKDYAQVVQDQGAGVDQIEPLSCADDLVERLMLGLRLAEGIAVNEMQSRAGSQLDDGNVQRLLDEKRLWLDEGNLGVYDPLLVDRIAYELLG